MTTTANDILGPKVCVEDSIRHLQSWFDGDDFIIISGKPENGGGVASRRVKTSAVIDLLSADNGETVLESLCNNQGTRYDVYINMSPIKEEFSTERGRRTKGQVSRVIGLVADFDVKEKGFTSWEHILDFLRTLELVPSIIVQSGTGGAHVYWKLSDPESVPVEEAKLLTEQHWAWLNEQAVAYGAGGVDRLVGVERMYRLAGTVNWHGGPVKLFYAGANTVSVSEVRELGAAPHARRQAYREALRSQERVRETHAVMGEGLTWDVLMKRDAAIARLSEIPWTWILTQAGWTWVGEDADGRQEWARPGKPGAKSATVDWPESPDVMSLFSTAEETRLSDLHEAGIVLTKERVLLRLLFGDDYAAMISWAVGL